ncbi:SEC-C metal-binding domain-containing protein [Paenibacillus artemisiicola]|uniref:SEC-C metal-binding domain-containing protein n=1 Tax=Paenibacillus artemisiicola TaxID=1172618 RepID=UPI0023E8625B|nr:SEC-C metal-binding domain-containing protein [Paenibacillus artemisiicola]
MKKSKVGRNAPCPCGSGNKYKKCCLEKDAAARFAGRGAGAPDGQAGGFAVAVPESLADMNAAVERLDWTQPQYGDIAKELVTHLAERFTWDEINATTLLWFAYSREQEPVVQKPGVVFAALEYSLSVMTDRPNVTKAEVAKRYDVSAGSVSKRIGELHPYVARTLEALAS